MEKANKLIASLSLLGNTIANSYCSEASGFKMSKIEENNIYMPNNSSEKRRVKTSIATQTIN